MTTTTENPTINYRSEGGSPMSSTLAHLTILAAIGSGVAGGVFFAFSTFVMPALNRLSPADSIRAMQAINVAAPNPLFMGLLFGTAALCVGVAVAGVRRWGAPGATLQVVGSALYLVAIVLTAVYHVPHNDALAKIDPTKVNAQHTWNAYYTGWTLLNHLRTAGPIAGATLLFLSTRAS
jgi:uncharacterized membrane protein